MKITGKRFVELSKRKESEIDGNKNEPLYLRYDAKAKGRSFSCRREAHDLLTLTPCHKNVQEEEKVDAKIFGRFISGIRKEKNMTQAELAEMIGVTDKAISRWERGVGFPDINTLEPLANALGISILELMRSEKMNMEKEKKLLTENEIAEMMVNAVEMERESRKQDKVSIWLGVVITIIVAIPVKLLGYANVGGALFIGAIAALFMIALYFFAKNKQDKTSRKIYSFFILVGLGLLLILLEIMQIDSYLLTWGIYCVLAVVLGFVNQEPHK